MISVKKHPDLKVSSQRRWSPVQTTEVKRRASLNLGDNKKTDKMIGKITPKEFHVLISRPCKYVRLYSNRNEFAYGIKVTYKLTLFLKTQKTKNKLTLK
jgi:hypothetical protein